MIDEIVWGAAAEKWLRANESGYHQRTDDLRNDKRFGSCLDANSYGASQHLDWELLEEGSSGIVYPSVRHKAGTCLVCFRPALVNNVWKGSEISIGFENAFATPEIREIKIVDRIPAKR
jgi:hypothetical protein